MGIGYWVRAVILCLSFSLVVWSMYSIRNHGLGSGVNEVLTGDRTAKVQSSRVEICETRVKGLKTSAGTEFYENGMSWFKKSSESHETKLDPVDVEKWFGHNCSLATEDLRPVASNESAGALPVLTLNFIQGGPESVRQTPSGMFIWKQFSFRSPQLEGALKDLKNLREAGPAGRANPSED